MSAVEVHQKKPVEVEMILWDGTDERLAEIQAWVADSPRPDHEPHAFIKDYEGCVELYVAHNRDWCHIPVGYRVAKELDGSGFYPLSPEGFAAGYVAPEVSERVPKTRAPQR